MKKKTDVLERDPGTFSPSHVLHSEDPLDGFQSPGSYIFMNPDLWQISGKSIYPAFFEKDVSSFFYYFFAEWKKDLVNFRVGNKIPEYCWAFWNTNECQAVVFRCRRPICLASRVDGMDTELSVLKIKEALLTPWPEIAAEVNGKLILKDLRYYDQLRSFVTTVVFTSILDHLNIISLRRSFPSFTKNLTNESKLARDSSYILGLLGWLIRERVVLDWVNTSVGARKPRSWISISRP